MGRKAALLTPVSRAVAHLARSSLSITKRKERDCVQSTISADLTVPVTFDCVCDDCWQSACARQPLAKVLVVLQDDDYGNEDTTACYVHIIALHFT